MDDDGRFPSIVDLFLRHGGSLETIEELIRGVKARADHEMENWCPDRIHIRASIDSSEPNIFLDDQKEAEKWEHVEELRLDEAHGGAPVGRCKQRARTGLLCKYCSVFQSLWNWLFLCSNCSITGSQDLKETSRIKSSFIHAMRGG